METININKSNFHEGTCGIFFPCETPEGTPDYISKDRLGYVSSKYYYTETGVIRVSDHWGKVASCNWVLAGFSDFQIKDCCTTKEPVSAYCSFACFEDKTKAVKEASFFSMIERSNAKNIYEKNNVLRKLRMRLLDIFGLQNSSELLFIPSY